MLNKRVDEHQNKCIFVEVEANSTTVFSNDQDLLVRLIRMLVLTLPRNVSRQVLLVGV